MMNDRSQEFTYIKQKFNLKWKQKRRISMDLNVTIIELGTLLSVSLYNVEGRSFVTFLLVTKE